jgi:hypothetical protein
MYVGLHPTCTNQLMNQHHDPASTVCSAAAGSWLMECCKVAGQSLWQSLVVSFDRITSARACASMHWQEVVVGGLYGVYGVCCAVLCCVDCAMVGIWCARSSSCHDR